MRFSHFTSRILLLLVCIPLLSISVQSQPGTTEPRSPLFLNFYQNQYDQLEKTIEKASIDRALKRINRLCSENNQITKDDIFALQSGDFSRLGEKCTTGNVTTLEEASRMKNTVLSIVESEKSFAGYEETLKSEIAQETVFGDARTDNTAYDLMVDLNTIDAIWFGEKAKFVRAPWGVSDLSFLEGAYDPSDATTLFRQPITPDVNPGVNNNVNNSQLAGNSNQNTPVRNSNTNQSGQQNTNSNSGGNTNTNGSLICAPENIAGFDTSTVRDILDSATTDRFAPSGDSAPVDTTGGDLATLPYATVWETRPEGEDDDISSDFSNDLDAVENIENDTSSATGIGDLSARLTCSTFFCIKISLKKGVATISEADNSIRGHMLAILRDLKKLNAYNLNLGFTTSGFLESGMANMNFVDRLHLDVFVSKKPIWSQKKYAFSSDDVQKIRDLYRPLRTQLLTNNCADLDLNVNQAQFSGEHQKNRDACIQLQTSWEKVLQEARHEARMQSEADMKPLEDEVARMRDAIQTIWTNFNDPDKGIRYFITAIKNKDSQ